MIYLNLLDRQLSRESFLHAAQACAEMLDLRSNWTGEQGARIEMLADRLGRRMKLSASSLRNLVIGAPLHDVGKIGIEDSILNKPAKLTDEERARMQAHPKLGYAVLRRLRFPEGIARVALYHHEWYDGSGYPEGLAGPAIPIEAQIFSVVDSFDAMISDRPYKKGRPIAEARQELEAFAGRQFAPSVVEAMRGIDDAELASLDNVQW